MKIPPQGCGVSMLDLDRAPNRPQTTRSGTACAAPALNWNCCTAIWSRFQMPSKWAFHPTWAAAEALAGLTGRTRRRRCPGKLIPAPAVLVSLILSSAVTSEMQFRRPAEALGRPGRRPMLAGGDARPLDARIAVQGPPRWGQGPFASTSIHQKSSKINVFYQFLLPGRVSRCHL